MKIIDLSYVLLILIMHAWALTTDLIPQRGDIFSFEHNGKPANYNFLQYGPLRDSTTGKFKKDNNGNEIWGRIPLGLPPVDGRSCRLVFKDAYKNVNVPATNNQPHRAVLTRSEVTAMPHVPALGQLYSHRYTLSGSDHVNSVECILKEKDPLDYFQILAKFGQLQPNTNVVNIRSGASWKEYWEERALSGNFENVARDYLDYMFRERETDARHIHDGTRSGDPPGPSSEERRGNVPRQPIVDM
ncbi:MAG: hypothetical protein HYV97_18325 [Bdellovibrio sp.]|nr:hypothetical protein [Bdellovibrio sp.]